MYQKVRIADIAEVKGGKRMPANAFLVATPTSHPYIRGRDIRNGKIAMDEPMYVRKEDFETIRRYTVNRGDVCITIVGNIGDVGITPSDLHGASLTENAVKLVNLREDIDAPFLAYALLAPEAQSQMKLSAAGAAQPKLGIYKVNEIQVALPPLPIQQRIAGILSAYDELIENSQRRIRILEAMARALYREWFVHFRFPGHDQPAGQPVGTAEGCPEGVSAMDGANQNHPRVASSLGEIPQGWEVKRLDEVCRSIQDGDWIETKDQGGQDYRLLQISNVGVGEFIETGNFRYVTQETFDRLRCNEIVSGDLLVARMPTPIGRGWLATKMPWRMITAVDVAIIRAEPTVIHPLFLVQAWNETSNLQRIAAQASGTTRLRITRRELAAMEFVIPPVSVQQQFAEIAQPQSAMIEALRQQIQNLRRTRDLLLPRLLSGQVDVEAA